MRRETLREHGVVYPGDSINHNVATSVVMGRRSPAWRGDPSPAAWDAVLSEIRSAPADSRALISYELVVQADDDAARRFAEDLGDQLHVVITARGLASLLPSVWQQYIKSGRSLEFRRWIPGLLDDERRLAAPRSGPGFWAEHDLAAQVSRWASVVGPERVHVVVVDKDHPDIATDAFETMLGLPRGTLRLGPEDGLATNRGLSALEVSILSRVNAEVAKLPVERPDYYALVRDGAVAALQQRRHPGADEGRIGVPPRFTAKVDALARSMVDAIAASGVSVVGDAAALASPAAPPVADKAPLASRLDVMTSLLRGALSSALDRGVDLEQDPATPFVSAAPPARRWRARDVLHVDHSARRVADGIGGPEESSSFIGGVARVVSASRTSRWVSVPSVALMDSSVRAAVFNGLNNPRVIVTEDGRARRATWEQALALGETRPFAEWTFDADDLLPHLGDDVMTVPADDDDAIAHLLADHPAPLTWNPPRRRLLTGAEAHVIRTLNETLDLPAPERLVAVGDGAIRGMRTLPPENPSRVDATARAVAGIVARAAGVYRE